MGGLNAIEKRMEVVSKFREAHFGVLGLCETKLRGSGREVWENINIIKSGVGDEGRAREGVAMMLSEEWNGCLVGEGYVSSRVMWAKFKKDRVKVAVIVAYAKCTAEGSELF